MRRSETPDPTSDAEPSALQVENEKLRRALLRAQAAQGELRSMIEQLTSTPWHPALFQRPLDESLGTRALVCIGSASRVVNLHPDVDGAELLPGDQVYLDHGQSTILARANGSSVPPSDSAAFVRFAEDGRLVVRSRDDELLLERAGRFGVEGLRAGHLVLFDRGSRIAFGRMENHAGRQYLMQEVGDHPLESVGGDRGSLDELLAVLTAALVEPELARDYGLDGRRAVLLYGPPGCGKTLMARTAAAEIGRRSGRTCRFAVVRPGEFESPYVGECESNIRACFAALGEAAEGGLAVLFLDEIESIGRIRGGAGGRHSDRFLAALLAEIDGFAERGQVAIVAATNRRDLLDPALLSRLSDVEIPVGRPDRAAARAILAVHLPAALPFADGEGAAKPGSQRAEALRAELLDQTVSLLYAPNAENELCALQLRDGTRRSVRARDLASGRLFAQIARAARQRAFRRDAARGEGRGAGLRSGDVAEAVSDALARLATTLSVHNARAWLDDLPDDVDVVRVEPVRPLPERSRRYLHGH